MKKRKGILPLFIALIAVGSISLGAGGYTGVRYYQSVKLEKEATRLFDSGKYSEALALYDKSLSRWKNKDVKNKRAAAEKENNFLIALTEGKKAYEQSTWQECVDKLNIVANDSRSYSEAQTMALECKGKIDEEASAKKKVEEEASDLAAKSAPKKSTTSSNTQGASPSSASSGASSEASSSSGTSGTSGTSSGSSGGGCTSNTSPVFSSHVTDTSKINEVIIPPRYVSGSFKPHSYIDTQHQRVPVYAPVAMTLIGGVFLSHGADPSDYGMDFKASCEVTIRFGHITDPVQPIKDVFGPTPTESSITNYNITNINFAAGELIGYTTGTVAAGNWDFGVYNSSTQNRYASDPNLNSSWVYTTAVCPYDYFSSGLKSSYSSKYQTVLGASTVDGESFCQ